MRIAEKIRRGCSGGIGSPVAAGVLIAASLMGMAPEVQAADAASHGELAGVWRIERPVFAVRTADGKEPPLKPAAAAVYQQRIEARKRGDTSFDSTTWCASPGMPRVLWIDYPLEIMVSPKHIAFLHEWNWWARIVYLDDALVAPAESPQDFGPPPGAPPGTPPMPPPGGPPLPGMEDASIPVSMGLSKGRWEGQTLVVETSELSDTTLLDSAGMPHSGQLKLTEHIRLRGPDVLENRIRIEDPETFGQPWETVVTYRRQQGVDIQEDVCLDRIKTGAAAIRGE